MSTQEQLAAEIESLKEKVFGKRVQVDSESTVEPTEVIDTQNVESSNQPNTPTDDFQTAPENTQEDVTEKKKYTDWKNRYKTYKASCDSTIHQLRIENVQLSESNLSMSKRIEDLQKIVSNIPKEDIYKDLFTDEEKDTVGESTITSMKKATNAAVNAAVKPLQEALEEERKLRLKQIESRVVESNRSINESFIEKLEELAPNYLTYDTDQGFATWMNEVDVYSNIPRIQLFHQARNIGDAKRVSEFFNDYEEKVTERTKKLDSNIAPSKSTSSAQIIKDKPKELTFTQASALRFYDDCIKGKFVGKEKLRKEIEDAILLAQARGAIR